MQLQISRKILVRPVDQPPQLCYNASVPFWPVSCLPSERQYCSVTPPEYGCTTDLELACTDLHLCNVPDSYVVIVLLLFALLLLLLVTGCFWCCFCCFCGRCCRDLCPCFTQRNDRVAASSSTLALSSSTTSRDMYAGIEQVIDSKMGSANKNNAGKNINDKELSFTPMPHV